MELASLAAKPQLVEMVIDDREELIANKATLKSQYSVQLKAKTITKEEHNDLVDNLNKMQSLVDEYGEGEPITFWTWDRLPLDTFMRLANADEENVGEMIGIVKPLMLDKVGKQIMARDLALPTKVLVQAIKLIVAKLGK